jgi:hypothetical protein
MKTFFLASIVAFLGFTRCQSASDDKVIDKAIDKAIALPRQPVPAPRDATDRHALQPQQKSKAEMVCDGMYNPSNWMGDGADPACDGVLRVTHEDKDTFGEQKTCERWEYKPSKGKVDWVAVAYATPGPGFNFGEKKGKDLRGHGYRYLVFAARGMRGNERIIFKGGAGTAPDALHKSTLDEVSLGTVSLTKQWQEFKIDLGEGADFTNVPVLLTFATNSDLNSDGCVFFISSVKLVSE